LWTAICLISGSDLSPAHCRSFCLSSLCFLEVHGEVSFLPSPPFSTVLRTPCPLCCMFLFSSLFIIIFLWDGGGQSVQGLCWLSQGWLWEYHMLLTCSPDGLPSRFGASVWCSRSPPVFSVLHGVEKLCTGWGFSVSEF
jgi:hypothetical protein